MPRFYYIDFLLFMGVIVYLFNSNTVVYFNSILILNLRSL